MPKVKVGDINMYYEIHGEGEPLVFMNGLGVSMALLFKHIPIFSREYSVIGFDKRGSGRSDAPDIPYSMEMMADDLAGLLDAIGINAAHINGISMGGMIAQHFSLRHPEKVKSLTLACTNFNGSHALVPDPTTTQERTQLQSTTDKEERNRQQLALMVSQDFIDNNPEFIRQYLAKMAEYPPPFHGFTRQSQAIAAHDTYERLPEIKAPTLVIHGEDDRIFPVAISRTLASRIPGAELAIIKNMGHLYYEAWDEVTSLMLDFLRRHSTNISG
jgi:3-oxoadipate enol-lactonase